MKSFIAPYVRFCVSGFGLGVAPARACGIAVLIVTFIFVVAFYFIKWLVQLVMNRKNTKQES